MENKEKTILDKVLDFQKKLIEERDFKFQPTPKSSANSLVNALNTQTTIGGYTLLQIMIITARRTTYPLTKTPHEKAALLENLTEIFKDLPSNGRTEVLNKKNNLGIPTSHWLILGPSSQNFESLVLNSQWFGWDCRSFQNQIPLDIQKQAFANMNDKELSNILSQETKGLTPVFGAAAQQVAEYNKPVDPAIVGHWLEQFSSPQAKFNFLATPVSYQIPGWFTDQANTTLKTTNSTPGFFLGYNAELTQIGLKDLSNEQFGTIMDSKNDLYQTQTLEKNLKNRHPKQLETLLAQYNDIRKQNIGGILYSLLNQNNSNKAQTHQA